MLVFCVTEQQFYILNRILLLIFIVENNYSQIYKKPNKTDILAPNKRILENLMECVMITEQILISINIFI